MVGAAESSGAGPQGDAEVAFDFSQVLSIADALPTLVAYVGPDKRYRFVNKAFADFFERPRRELLGQGMPDVMGPEAWNVRAPMAEAALRGERQWFAAEFEHPTRGTLAVQTEYVPQRASPDGPVTGFVVLVQDVTEQRIAERALRESEARFRRIADSAPVMMWVTRLDRSRDFVNDAYLEFAGITAEEMNSHNWREWIHPDDFDRVVRESVAGEASLKPFTLEARYRRADGEWRWLRSVSSPRFGPDDELVGFIGAAFDITPAKQAELELKSLVDARTAELSASEARFRAIFDAVQEVIVLLRPDGTVLEVNRTSAPWRAEHPEQSIGGKLWDSPTVQAFPDIVPLIHEAVRIAASGESYSREVTLARPGLPTFHLSVTLHPIRGPSGEMRYLLFEARDVTELRGAQEQLRQSQKMEALGQLTGGIAHDFNNLLTVVVGGLDLIVKRAADEKLKRYAANALEAAERGARLTAQLLAFSRVQRLEVRPTFVAPLVEHMRPLLKNVLGPGIDKQFDLDEERVPILADPTQLELAVLNLVINARDAMPEGGTLTIRTLPMTISDDPELEPGDYVELSITDTGSGMPPEVAERAFEPFFTTKEVGKGTGLGLSMVYGVARQSGGTARIESRPGDGTTVRLYFRRAATADTAPDAEPNDSPAPEPARAARILIVDDDADVRGFVAATVEDLGYEVREAGDGDGALAEFRHERPDLVILDFIMPGMSGADVAKVMLTEQPGQPILFVSGYSETEAIKRVAPGAPLLAKPFRAEALDAAIRSALASS